MSEPDFIAVEGTREFTASPDYVHPLVQENERLRTLLRDSAGLLDWAASAVGADPHDMRRMQAGCDRIRATLALGREGGE